MNLKSSIFTRLALALTVIPVLVLILIGVWTYGQTAKRLKQETINQINDDMASISEVYISGGPQAVSALIQQRLKLVPTQRAGGHYLFSAAAADLRAPTVLAGDLAGLIEPSQDLVTVRDIQTQKFGPLLARTTVYKGGERLVVARNDEPRREALRALAMNFFIGCLALLASSAVLARLVAGRFRARINRMNRVFNMVGDGHLDARVPGRGGEDEISVLGRHVNDMLTRTERLLQLRKRITDQVAHEMRSPLTRLDAGLVNAAASADDPAAIESAREELKRCVALLDGLLDISALDAQKGDRTGFAPFDISALCRSIAELFAPVAEDDGKSIVLDVTDDMSVHGEPAQLGRLVSNLLDNAVKYADPDSEITVKVEQSDLNTQINISNMGPDIPKQAAKDIFTPFFRSPGAASQNGYGLGLALCRSIADRHNGCIRVTSLNGKTTFKFTMPNK